MQVVRLAHETDFQGWREAARRLRAEGTPPDRALWTVDGEANLFSPQPLGDGDRAKRGGGSLPEALSPGLAPSAASRSPSPKGGGERTAFTVPKAFVDLAGKVILNRSDERFAILYRLLWRLQAEPKLLQIASDPDVARSRDLASAVSRAAHKMKAFVRFRMTRDDLGEAYVAWFEPAHRVTEAVAPFFARRFTAMRWSILTPDACAHWDMTALTFTPGADSANAPREDALEDYWRTYYASIFNPARLKTGAMQKEMPKRYWRNLPEAGLIPELIASAQDRTTDMVRHAPTEPSRRVVKSAIRNSRDAPSDGGAPSTLEDIAAGVDHCRRCDLWQDATQGVTGQGPARAKLMFVGEQPGDQEDLAGLPFVGPAGQMLDRALAEAGVPRAETYVTNAVKHFKHELRGKRRIHKTPNAGEVTACRWWLEGERQIVRPRVIVALGATAASSVFGRPIAIGQFRQKALPLSEQAQGVVTYHPSYLLRLPDADAKAKAYAMFVEDLKFAWSLAPAA